MNPLLQPYYFGSNGGDYISPGYWSFNWQEMYMYGGDDTVIAFPNAQPLKVFGGSGNDNITTSNRFDYLNGGSGNDILDGKESNDVLVGDADNDRLIGGQGFDYLTGGTGKDTMTGGTESDIFRFDAALTSANIDHITDFTNTKGNDDIIHLDHEIFTPLKLGTLNPAFFKDITGGAAIDANDRILYNRDKGALYYDADGSGTASKAVAFAVLDNHAALTFQDFHVF